MTKTKAWDWQKNTDQRWLTPSNEIHYLADRWQDKGYRDFLDLGCGLGRHSIFMAQQGFQVTAFDLADYGLEFLQKWQAAEELKNITIKQGDMLELPFADQSFDCILAYHVVNHTDTVGFKKVVAEINRVLRPGGEVFLTLLSQNSWTFINRDPARMIDDHTLLRDEIETEKDVPHFFLGVDDLPVFWGDWEFKQTPAELIEYFPDGKFSAHWHLLVSPK